MKTLKDLFLDQLSDMYDAEHRILKALPDLIKTATCHELQSALENHLQETEGQVTKLERVFGCFDEKPREKKCPATVGLLKEGEELASTFKKTPVVNAAVICAAQKVEHYEMASYGCLHAWAILLGNQEAANLIEEILDEEKNADQTLNELSLSKNQEALEGAEPGTGREHAATGRPSHAGAPGIRDDR